MHLYKYTDKQEDKEEGTSLITFWLLVNMLFIYFLWYCKLYLSSQKYDNYLYNAMCILLYN